MSSATVNPAYETLKPYVPGKPIEETQRELGLEHVIKLASNENPHGPSPTAIEAIKAHAPLLYEYPDGSAYHLRQRLSEMWGLPADWFLPGNGSNEIIDMLIRTFVLPGENVVTAQPSFVAYALCAQASGTEFIEVPMNDYQFDVDAIAKAVTDKTKLLFLANPNNPTGTYIRRDDLTRLLEGIPDSVITVLDEAYVEYVEADDYPDGKAWLKQRPRTLLLRTMSKAYGMAGLRLGYVVGEPDLLDYLNRGRHPFNVNTLAQVAATAALGDQAHVDRSVTQNQAGRRWVTDALSQLGLKVVPSQANFVLVDTPAPATEIFEKMLRRGVIVRPFPPLGAHGALRISIGTSSENETMVDALKASLA